MIDKTANWYLEGVLCKVVGGPQQVYTNAYGDFELSYRTGYCLFNCDDVLIEFSKAGYQTQTVKVDPGNNIIYMEK